MFRCIGICFMMAQRDVEVQRQTERQRSRRGGGINWTTVAMHPQCVTRLSMVCCYEKKSKCKEEGQLHHSPWNLPSFLLCTILKGSRMILYKEFLNLNAAHCANYMFSHTWNILQLKILFFIAKTILISCCHCSFLLLAVKAKSMMQPAAVCFDLLETCCWSRGTTR